MKIGTIDYLRTVAPLGYICSACGAHGCKLWRGANGAPVGIWCCDCAAKSQDRNISDMSADGTHTDPDSGARTDVIGWRVPAIPDEAGASFWGYTSAPKEAYEWWRRLPLRQGGESA